MAESEFWDTFYTSKCAWEQSPFTAAIHEKILEIIPDEVETRAARLLALAEV